MKEETIEEYIKRIGVHFSSWGDSETNAPDWKEPSDFCGLDDDTHEYGGPCTEETCPKRLKYRWEFFHEHCKYRNRDYGPP